MIDSKLIEILKSFSAEEFKSFEKFIKSPFFSTGRNVTKLYFSIFEYFPDFHSRELEKEKLFSKLFPDEDFNLKKLKNQTSDLTRLAESFLVHSAVKNDKAEFEKKLAAEYKNRKLDGLFAGALRSLEKLIPKNNFTSVKCFDDEEKIERLWEEYYISVNDFSRSVPYRIKYTDSFSLSFLVSFLRKMRDRIIITDYYNLAFESSLQNALFETLDFRKLIGMLEKAEYEYTWLIKMYYAAYRSTTFPEETGSYIEFKNIFFENKNKFAREEKYFIFNDFVACCNRVRDVSGNDMSKEVLLIHMQMLEEKAFSPHEDEYLSPLLYRNILNLSIELGELDWLNTFIEEYTRYLNPAQRVNMKNLAEANLAFAKDEFEASLGCINKLQYDIFIFKSDAKNLMLKLYYELELFEQAFSLVDTYRHYLTSSTDLSDYFKTQISSSLVIYAKLLKARTNDNVDDAIDALNFLDKAGQVTSGSWLRAKLNELIKKGA